MVSGITSEFAAHRVSATKDVAENFKVSERTVFNWIEGGCPHTPGKGRQGHKFDLAEVAAWKQRNNITGEPGRPPEVVSEDLEQVRIRKETAMAKNWELRNGVLEKELIPAAEVRQAFTEEVTRAKSRLSGIPAEVAGACVGLDAGDIQNLLEQQINAVLSDLATGLS